MLDYEKETMGLDYLESVISKYQEYFENKTRINKRETLLFLPTNGTGLGHMTRLLAIAKRVRKLNPEIKIIFFTTSYASAAIVAEGFESYYFPSRDLCLEEVVSNLWNSALERALTQVVAYYRPKCLVFDGTFPYLGIMNGMSVCEKIKKIWVKRGNNKIEDSEKVKKKEDYFDLIIEPGEAGTQAIKNDKYYYCNPIVYMSKDELLERKEARMRLEIPEDELAIYIQLGAGKINSIQDEISSIIDALEKKYEVYIVVGESVIGKQLQIRGKHMKIIREYPNSKYFNAFDVAFSAAGYNTFHELLYFGVPSVFIPNPKTQKDSQINRAEGAKNLGAAHVIYDCEEEKIQQAFEAAIQNSEMLRCNALSLIEKNGAEEVATIIMESIKTV